MALRSVRERRLTTWPDLIVGLALVALVVGETLGKEEAPHPVLRAVLAAIGVSSVALRRTSPAAAGIILSVAMAVESFATESPDELGVLIAVLLVTYSVGAHADLRESLPVGALLSMALSVAIALDPSDSVSNIPPSLLLFVAAPFVAGLVVRRRTREVQTLTARTETLAHEAEAAVDAERRRIARELHDVVSHAVTLIAVQAEAGQAVLETDPAAAGRSLAAIATVGREALAELARLLAVLREEDDDPGAEAGLARVASLLEGARAAGLVVEVRETGTGTVLDPHVDRCAYRIIQESLTNALRHTGDAHVSVELGHGPERLLVAVRSTGSPHSSSYGGTGRGLTGLHERVVGLGGTFESGPTDGGFALRAELPVAFPVPAGS